MEQYRSGHNGLDSKSSNPLTGTEGSNPSCSAKKKSRRQGGFSFCTFIFYLFSFLFYLLSATAGRLFQIRDKSEKRKVEVSPAAIYFVPASPSNPSLLTKFDVRIILNIYKKYNKGSESIDTCIL